LSGQDLFSVYHTTGCKYEICGLEAYSYL